MSDTEDTEVRVAAAEGAAAAVDAVHDDQERRETEASMAVQSEVATGAAAEAAERAEQAAEAATMASEAAVQATETAQQASGEAQQASETAHASQQDIADVREEMSRGWSEMRSYLDEKFTPPVRDEPTEVVVSDAANSAGNNGTDAGSAGGTGDNPGTGSGDNSGPDRTRRHRFGRR